MGRWNRRYYPRSNRRSRYQDYDWSPPRETYRDPEFGVWEDNVPMWEKKFCFSCGVPWEKVLSTNKFMHCHSNILEWDDTAGKEAFHNAKECYRAKLNGEQCEIHPPDPDAYIGEIDWNPYIDPELMADLDRIFFAPDDKEKESRDEDTIHDYKFNTFGSLKDPEGTLDKSNNAWDCDHPQTSGALKDKAAGWNLRDDSVDAHEEPTNNSNPWESHDKWDCATLKYNDEDNPWERGHAQTSQVSKDKTTGWNQWDAYVDARDKPTNNGNSWECHERRDSAMPKSDDNNNPWQRGHAQRSQIKKNKAAGWIQYNDCVNATEEKRSNYGNSWGYHDRPGSATARYGSRGGASPKTCDRKPESYMGKVKNSVDNGSKWRNGNRWQDFGESSWGRNQWETGINRSSYPNGSYYSANKKTNVGASKEGWGQKQYGQYGWPRRGSAEEREDMAGACRKREGSGQNEPGHRGPKLQYVDQTSRRWNNGSSNKRGWLNILLDAKDQESKPARVIHP